jgi:hypothetical protein
MDPSDAARRLVREQYAAVRQALTLLDQQVLARYWDEGTPVRAGFGRFLGSLDEAAGRLLGDEDTSWSAQDPQRTEPGTAPAEPGTAAEPESAAPAAEPGMVEVTFTLPAEVEAASVALAGEFNDWATDETMLERGGDGTWRATVALAPGRSYRYRYLLDGERWENAWHADRYEPNSFGSIDSVIVVE